MPIPQDNQGLTPDYANAEVASRRRGKKITDGFLRIEVIVIAAAVATWGGWIAWSLLT